MQRKHVVETSWHPEPFEYSSDARTLANNPQDLVQQAIANLETLQELLDQSGTHWLHGIIDTLRVYAEELPEIPSQMDTAYCPDGIILRRGLQSFVVSEDEFPQVRNAFRRCKIYRKRQDTQKYRVKVTLTE